MVLQAANLVWSLVLMLTFDFFGVCVCVCAVFSVSLVYVFCVSYFDFEGYAGVSLEPK